MVVQSVAKEGGMPMRRKRVEENRVHWEKVGGSGGSFWVHHSIVAESRASQEEMMALHEITPVIKTIANTY